YATAGVRSGAGEVEPVEEEPVPGRAEQGSPGEELIERRLGVLEVAAREAVRRLEVGGRDDLDRFDELAEAGRVAFERLHGDLADPFAFRGPVAVAKYVGRRLERHVHHVLPLGRERRVRERWDRG